MKRLILSTIGVAITFAVIVYTAPPAERTDQKESGIKVIVKTQTAERQPRTETQKVRESGSRLMTLKSGS